MPCYIIMFFQKIVKSSVVLSLLFLYQSMQEICLCLVAALAVFAVQVQMEHVAVRRNTLASFFFIGAVCGRRPSLTLVITYAAGKLSFM